MFCGNCGADAGEAKLCPNCGAVVDNKERVIIQQQDQNYQFTNAQPNQQANLTSNSGQPPTYMVQQPVPMQRCNRCGSTNMTATIQSSTKFKQGHGCLWAIFFGWLYFFWIFLKWMAKYMVVIFWYICCEWERAIYLAIKRRKYAQPIWLKRMMRKRGKAYTEHETVFICNNCGHKQKSSEPIEQK